MSILDNIKMGISSVLEHKLRSTLTIIGIVIGIAAVILVVSIGKGGEELLKSNLTSSDNVIQVTYNPESMTTQPEASPFTEQDIRGIENVKGIDDVVASNTTSSTATYLGNEEQVSINTGNEDYINSNTKNISIGRSFMTSDILSGARTVIINSELANTLLEDEEPIGKLISINGNPVKIIGVLDESSNVFSLNTLELYIPDQTYRNLFGSIDYNKLSVEVTDKDEIGTIGDEITALLNGNHNTEEVYSVYNHEEMSKSISQITNIMTIIIGSVAGISLVVGGIGIMNMMLVSVTERTREIGVRKSLGATYKQILQQFLTEAIVLSLFGGILGIAFGTLMSVLVSVLFDWPSLISYNIVILSILFSTIIGILFGIIPASKAAKLDPIESLRYE